MNACDLVERYQRRAREPESAQQQQGNRGNEGKAAQQSRHLPSILPKNREKLLKVLLFALVAAITHPALAQAGEPDRLLVGAVRDADGIPLEDAQIEAFGGDRRPVGRGRADPSGTFAIDLERDAAWVEVSCRYCVRRTERLRPGEPVVIVVDRYRALRDRVPSERDIAVLPFANPFEVIGLVPFFVPSANQVSDRGLARGRGLVLDAGIPTYDIVAGNSGLIDFPARAVRRIGALDADQAYRYGGYAGGGTLALERSAGTSAFELDGGRPASTAIEGALGHWRAALATSRDGDVDRDRADVAFEGVSLGGHLRADVAMASSNGGSDGTASARLGGLTYFAASPRYRTFAHVGARSFVQSDLRRSDVRSSVVGGEFRLERIGPLRLAVGAAVNRENGSLAPTSLTYLLNTYAQNETVYAEAATGGDAAAVRGALALMRIESHAGLLGATIDRETFALFPAIEARVRLARGVAARVGVSSSLRPPALTESLALPTAVSERGRLLEAAVTYDTTMRLRAELVTYGEKLDGIAARSLAGRAVSVVWQVAPRWSLRAWTLNNSVDSTQSYPVISVYGSGAPVPTTRSLVWSTYENPTGLRFDAIFRRAAGSRFSYTAVDGDFAVPVRPWGTLVVGETRRADGPAWHFGLRFSTP